MTGIGHNNPPDPIDSYTPAIEDARTTAQDFIDGKPISTQAEADAIGRVISETKSLRKDMDEARKAEKKPHDDASKAVQAKWKPLLDRADTIVTACQKPLTAYLNKLAAEQEAERKAAAEAAEKAAREALEAERAAQTVADIEAAKAKADEAKAAQKASKQAEKAKPHVQGMNRAVGLRTYKVATVTDYKAALLWIAKHDKAALDAFIEDYAKRCNLKMDGVEVTEERRVA